VLADVIIFIDVSVFEIALIKEKEGRRLFQQLA
jgi:hypothetical protein